MVRVRKIHIVITCCWLIMAQRVVKSQNTVSHMAFTKGRIEWLIPKTLPIAEPIIQQALNLSANSLEELERNLIYKTSDRVHLVLFDDFADYQQYYQRKYRLSSKSSHDVEPLHNGIVYQPILCSGNIIDLEYQIKRAIARQFISEFLLGFSYRDRFNIIQQQNTPIWLKEGFIEYYAAGISGEDFLQFKEQLKTPGFRNLNFIDPHQQVLFGKVLWYFFEKEKGRNLNSVFWMLIKYAQSFDKSFEYHFNMSFKDWLRARINELQQTETYLSPRVDFQTNAPKKQLNKSRIVFEPQANQAIITQFNESGSRSYLWDIKHASKRLLLEENYLYEPPTHDFRTPTYAYSTKNQQWAYVSWDGAWVLNIGTKKIKLPGTASYRLWCISSDTAFLLQETAGHTYLSLYYLESGEKLGSLMLNSQFEKIQELHKIEPSALHIVKTIRLDTGFVSQLVRYSYDTKLTAAPLYEVAHDRAEWTIQSILMKDSTSFSLVRNAPLENAVYHIQPKLALPSLIKTPVKGLQYQQFKFSGRDSFIEFYIANKRWNINIIDINAPVFDSDTFKRQELSFDTVLVVDSTKKDYDSYPANKKFTSPFKRPKYIIYPIETTNRTPEAWRASAYSPWFYLHAGQFILSNTDFRLPYDAAVRPTEQYNSPLTFISNHQIADVSQRHRLGLQLFSNLNRRRIGISMDHTFIQNPETSHHTKLQYRLRQFDNSKGISFRNRNIGGSYQYQFRYHRTDWHIGIEGNSSQIIALNNAIENVQHAHINQYIFESPLGASFESKDLNKPQNHMYYNALLDLNIGGIVSDNKANPILSIAGSLKLKRSFYIFEWRLKSTFRYAFTEQNKSFMLGGSEGWISQSANTDALYKQLRNNQLQFLEGGLFVRGLQVGTRIGNSFVHFQQDVGLPLLRLFPKTLKERIFWRSMVIYAFIDAGLAFYGSTPAHYSNPYNNITLYTPNYSLTASSVQNPWIFGTGFGAQVSLMGYPIRIEYAEGRIGSLKSPPRLLLSLGKNF